MTRRRQRNVYRIARNQPTRPVFTKQLTFVMRIQAALPTGWLCPHFKEAYQQQRYRENNGESVKHSHTTHIHSHTQKT